MEVKSLKLMDSYDDFVEQLASRAILRNSTYYTIKSYNKKEWEQDVIWVSEIEFVKDCITYSPLVGMRRGVRSIPL